MSTETLPPPVAEKTAAAAPAANDPIAAAAADAKASAAAAANVPAADAQPKADADKEKSGTQDKQAEADKKPVEVKYDVRLPADAALGQSDVDRIVAKAKERGLSNEHAQMLLDHENESVKGWADAQKAAQEQQAKAWTDAVKADKEIGGDKFEKSVATATATLKRFASPALIETLNSTGLGNHPELVRLMAKVGAAMADDTLVTSGSSEPGQLDAAHKLFPNLK